MAHLIENKIRKYKNFTNNLIISNALKKANFLEREIYHDYSRDSEEFKEFIFTMQKESQRSRALTYRFISSEEGFLLIQNQLNSFRSIYPKDNFYINPILYLRICRPNLFIDKRHNESLLFTEPHYDKSNNFKFYSVWIPLVDTSDTTGSLCEFDKYALKIEFPIEGDNIFSLGRYLDSYKKVDSLLKEAVIPVYCESTSYLYWNSSTLHGATKPVTQNRVSLNYQVFAIPNDSFKPYDTESIAMNLFSQFPNLFCFAMLNNFEDSQGMFNLSLKNEFKDEYNECSFLNKDFTNKFINYIDLGLSDLTKFSKIPSKEKVHWSKDYQWIREIYDTK